jgi:hypothetical protein
MGANGDIRTLVTESGKPYFVAAGANLVSAAPSMEKAYNHEHSAYDDHYAAEQAARMFNDFNHMCSYWATYMGVEDFYYYESAHRLIWLFDGKIDSRVDTAGMAWLDTTDTYCCLTTLKYYYLRHIAQTFDVGCRFRRCMSNRNLPTKDMVYTFGQKPAINVTAAYNPDSTWSIGLVNLTSLISDTIDSCDWHPIQLTKYYDADTFEVTVHVEELANAGDPAFGVLRSNKHAVLAVKDSVWMTNGKLTISVPPREMVTLRSVPIAPTAIRATAARTPPAARLTLAGRMVRCNITQAGIYHLRLYSLRGRCLAHHTIAASKSGQYSIPLTHYSSSPCIVELNGSNGLSIKKREFMLR